MDKKTESTILKFFQLLGIKYTWIDIIPKEKNILLIHIKTDNSDIFIGKKSIHLDAIQKILCQMLNKNQEQKQRVHIQINDFQFSKDIKLFQFIQEKVDQVKRTWLDCRLPIYSPYERKKIHSYVADLNEKNIITKTVDEDSKRIIYICKKWISLTIYIDGDGI